MNSETLKYLIPGIVGLLGVLVGSLISFWSNYHLKSREAALRIHEKIFDKKVKAYEDLLFLIQKMRVGNVIKVNDDDNFFKIYPPSLHNKESLKQFSNEFSDITNRCKFWIDVEIVRLLHFFEGYLKELNFSLMNISEEKYISIGLIISKDFLKFASKLEEKLIEFFDMEIERPKIKTKRGLYKFDFDIYTKMMNQTEFKKNEKNILDLK